MRKFACLIFVGLGVLMPAKADLIFTGSQAGMCCFDVTLHQVSVGDIMVTATLADGAQWFVDTGSGQHPGFAFNISGDPSINITNLSTPWGSGDVHLTKVDTNGPSLGTFDYYIDNPGNGASLHNAGPLSFDVIGAGLLVTDFTTAAGSSDYFVADIMDAAGATGLSGITAGAPGPGPIPEPASILLFATVGLGLVVTQRRRLGKLF